MTPAADLRTAAVLAALMSLLTACGGEAPPSADYIHWCQREFRIAEAMVRDAQSAIDEERPWISVEEYRLKFGEPPADGVFYMMSETGAPVALQAKTPEHLVELEASTQRVSLQLWTMEKKLRPDVGRSLDFSSDALEDHDREAQYRTRLIESGKTAEDLLPKLEECFEKLPAVNGGCDDACR